MSNAYQQGFIEKCAQFGINPQLLVKFAQEAGETGLSSRISDEEADVDRVRSAKQQARNATGKQNVSRQSIDKQLVNQNHTGNFHTALGNMSGNESTLFDLKNQFGDKANVLEALLGKAEGDLTAEQIQHLATKGLLSNEAAAHALTRSIGHNRAAGMLAKGLAKGRGQGGLVGALAGLGLGGGLGAALGGD